MTPAFAKELHRRSREVPLGLLTAEARHIHPCHAKGGQRIDAIQLLEIEHGLTEVLEHWILVVLHVKGSLARARERAEAKATSADWHCDGYALPALHACRGV